MPSQTRITEFFQIHGKKTALSTSASLLEDTPPPYSCCNSETAIESRSLSASAESVARLRRFLLYCVKRALRLPTSDTMTDNDWLFFIGLSKKVHKTRFWYRPTVAILSSDEDYDHSDPYLEGIFLHSVARPAEEIGVPVWEIAILIRGLTCDDIRKPENNALFGGTQCEGISILAKKVFQFREIMIPAITIEGSGLQHLLMARLQEVAERMFTKLDGPTSYAFSEIGKEWEKRFKKASEAADAEGRKAWKEFEKSRHRKQAVIGIGLIVKGIKVLVRAVISDSGDTDHATAYKMPARSQNSKQPVSRG